MFKKLYKKIKEFFFPKPDDLIIDIKPKIPKEKKPTKKKAKAKAKVKDK